LGRVHEADAKNAVVLYEQYWFDTFYQVLETLRTFPGRAAESIQVSDWAKLASSLGNDSYTATDVRQLFYPKRGSNDNDSAGFAAVPTPETSRQAGFFSSLDKKNYHDLFRHVLQHHPTLPFPDVQSLLRIKKDEGETMTRVMDHVVRWVNTQPVDIVDRHENNKPLRRQDLMPAIQELMATAYGTDWWAQPREEGDDGGADDVATWLELRSRSLEKQVLDYVRRHMTRFKDPSTKHYLALMPEEHDDSYAERFAADDLWAGLFRIVQDTIGPALRPVWQDAEPERVGDLRGGDEAHHQNNGTRRRPASAITRAICSQLGNIPEVKENPALSGVYASTELGAYIDHAVLAWAADRCRKAVENNESDDGAPWPSEALQTIQLAYQGYEKLLSEVMTTTPPDGQQQQQPPPPSFPQRGFSSQLRDSHVPEQNAMPSNQYMIKQPSSSQGFVPINMTSGGQGRNGQTREIARQAGLSLMQQPTAAAVSPSPRTVRSSKNRKGGNQGRRAMGHSPPRPHPVAEVGRSLHLAETPVRGARVVQSSGGRKGLPSGQRNPGRLNPTNKNDASASQSLASPSWTRGPVATSGSRR
jgi:hypothetical protein